MPLLDRELVHGEHLEPVEIGWPEALLEGCRKSRRRSRRAAASRGLEVRAAPRTLNTATWQTKEGLGVEEREVTDHARRYVVQRAHPMAAPSFKHELDGAGNMRIANADLRAGHLDEPAYRWATSAPRMPAVRRGTRPAAGRSLEANQSRRLRLSRGVSARSRCSSAASSPRIDTTRKDVTCRSVCVVGCTSVMGCRMLVEKSPNVGRGRRQSIRCRATRTSRRRRRRESWKVLEERVRRSSARLDPNRNRTDRLQTCDQPGDVAVKLKSTVLSRRPDVVMSHGDPLAKAARPRRAAATQARGRGRRGSTAARGSRRTSGRGAGARSAAAAG